MRKFVGNQRSPHNLERHIMYEILVTAQQRGKSQTKNSRGNDKGRSKSRKGLVECHYCRKKGHMKKDCYPLKNKERGKEKGKTHGDGHVMQVTCSSSQ